MPRQNRVTPTGELEAVSDRGLLWGNRGQLLDRHGELARHHRGRLWLICVLAFKGRRRTQWQPGRLTELYFLDEATGLAAGHRPCGECRYPAYRSFKRLWADTYPDRSPSAAAIDVSLHAERLDATGSHRSHRADPATLPDGTLVALDGRPWLVRGDAVLAWSQSGYTTRRSRPTGAGVDVLTPRTTVAILRAGYEPVLHPSAEPS